MEVNEQLIRAITQAVIQELQKTGRAGTDTLDGAPVAGSKNQPLAGRTRMRPKHSYEGAERAPQGTDPKEIVIGVGAAFQTEIRATITGIPLEEVIPANFDTLEGITALVDRLR